MRHAGEGSDTRKRLRRGARHTRLAIVWRRWTPLMATGCMLVVLGCLGGGSDAETARTGGASRMLTPAGPLPPPSPLTPAPSVVGNPEVGRRLFVTTGCAGCHTIRGVPAAAGVAGPNLTNVVLRPTLAGESIPMTPDTMVRWLLDPAAVKPGATMPDVGLTPQEAQDLTAFLYSQPYNPEK
ncbi:MAG: c-type cytochrome [Chloroflexota bacterium]